MLHHLARSLLLGDSSLLALMTQVVMLGRPTMTSVMVIFKCQLGWTMVPRYLVKHYSGCFWCVCMKLRNAIFPAISVNKDVTVISDCSNHEWWAGMPKYTQEGKEYLPFSSHQIAATPCSEAWGNSGYGNTGYWPQIAEVHNKGMISVTPDTCIFPYTEKH